MRRLLLTSALGIFSLISGCSETKAPHTLPSKDESGTQIVVTSRPLLEMTQTLIGEHASTMLVIPDGISSPDWSPTAEDARTMQKAGLVLLSGAGYEPWKDRVSLPRSRVRDTAAGYYDQLIRIPDAVTHQHGPGGSHSHPGTVWATWLAPELCAAQLHQVSLNCIRLLPDHKQDIETAEAKLGAELNSLNSMILSIKAAAKDNALVVFSDAPHYQYLTQQLGWELRYLHWTASASLTNADRMELQNLLKLESETTTTGINRRLFLLDSRHSVEAETFVRDSGVTVIRIDLCATASPELVSLPGRLKQNLQGILDALGKSLDSKGRSGKDSETR